MACLGLGRRAGGTRSRADARAERRPTPLAEGRRPVLAVLAAALCVTTTASYGSPALRPDVTDAGAVRASLPLGVELVRLPLSAFVPTVELPLLAAVVQVLVVVGLAELLVGRLATVTVAIVSQVLCSLLGRVLVQAGGLFGLPITQAGVLDTGPSAITTALGAWLLLRYRAYWCLGLLAGALLVAAGLQDNLDGREHLAAVLCGLALPGLGRCGRRLAAATSRLLTRAPGERPPAVHRALSTSARRPPDKPGQIRARFAGGRIAESTVILLLVGSFVTVVLNVLAVVHPVSTSTFRRTSESTRGHRRHEHRGLVKQVPDTEGERKLDPADNTVDRAAVDPVINYIDEFAIEEGLRLKEAHGGEVTILSVGPSRRPSRSARRCRWAPTRRCTSSTRRCTARRDPDREGARQGPRHGRMGRRGRRLGGHRLTDGRRAGDAGRGARRGPPVASLPPATPRSAQCWRAIHHLPVAPDGTALSIAAK